MTSYDWIKARGLTEGQSTHRSYASATRSGS
jgi:hypothetical protein